MESGVSDKDCVIQKAHRPCRSGARARSFAGARAWATPAYGFSGSSGGRTSGKRSLDVDDDLDVDADESQVFGAPQYVCMPWSRTVATQTLTLGLFPLS